MQCVLHPRHGLLQLPVPGGVLPVPFLWVSSTLSSDSREGRAGLCGNPQIPMGVGVGGPPILIGGGEADPPPGLPVFWGQFLRQNFPLVVPWWVSGGGYPLPPIQSPRSAGHRSTKSRTSPGHRENQPVTLGGKTQSVRMRTANKWDAADAAHPDNFRGIRQEMAISQAISVFTLLSRGSCRRTQRVHPIPKKNIAPHFYIWVCSKTLKGFSFGLHSWASQGPLPFLQIMQFCPQLAKCHTIMQNDRTFIWKYFLIASHCLQKKMMPGIQYFSISKGELTTLNRGSNTRMMEILRLPISHFNIFPFPLLFIKQF